MSRHICSRLEQDPHRERHTVCRLPFVPIACHDIRNQQQVGAMLGVT
jgi:hypothetical protein